MNIKAQRPPRGERILAARHFPQPKGSGPNGRNFCRVCHEEVGPRRRSVCDDECERMFLDLIDPVRVVEREEKGVCQLCGWDMDRLERILQHAKGHRMDLDRGHWWKHRADIFMPLGLSRSDAGRTTIYDYDHIIPIVEGGRHERANLRTLCLPCHKGETAALMRRLADAARQQDYDEKHSNQMELI